MDLFATPSDQSTVPLAHRMRPRNLEEFSGQEHLLAPGKPLRRLIEADSPVSFILWGPPGCGKTTLAHVISRLTHCRFANLSAVTSGVNDLRELVRIAEQELKLKGRRTIIFIDEIHRFNKAQQDAILPHVEQGTISLIGSTTENPAFEVISALRSRCRIYRLEPLSAENLRLIIAQALQDIERGLGRENIVLDEAALENIVAYANGDARLALNALETAASIAPPVAKPGPRRISRELIEQVLQRASLLYDKAGDEHYDHASAYQKSLRGSDPDAAIYWLGKMIAGGEDPRFIARRLMATAAEDVGNADPQALSLASAAAIAAEKLGWPEARLPLAQATLYVACAPKSNSTITAIDKALSDIEKRGKGYPVPPHLKSAQYSEAKKYGFGQGYKYPHIYPGHFVDQVYLPEKLIGTRYYDPGEEGAEKEIKLRMEKLRKKGEQAKQ
jgi:putative ATPase